MLTITIVVSLVVAVVAAVIYFASSNAKVVELAKLSFFAGLLVGLAQLGGVVRLGG